MVIAKIVTDIKRDLQTVLDAFQQRLTFGENHLATEITEISPAVADTEFTVTHSLGKTPRSYIYNTDIAATVYDSRRTSWTENLIYLKCSQPSVTITLTIL